jgi:hypothetical protein
MDFSDRMPTSSSVSGECNEREEDRRWTTKRVGVLVDWSISIKQPPLRKLSHHQQASCVFQLTILNSHQTFKSTATTIFTKMKYIAAIITVLRYVLYKDLQNEDFC